MEKPSKGAQLCWAWKSSAVARSGFSSCGQKMRPTCSAASPTSQVATRRNPASLAACGKDCPKAVSGTTAFAISDLRNYFKLTIISVQGKWAESGPPARGLGTLPARHDFPRRSSAERRRIRLSDRQARPAAGCSRHGQTGGNNMAALEKGITASGTGYRGKTWNILGQ